jgi:hypothetical protein
MQKKENKYLEIPRGILNRCHGYTPMFVIQKNGVLRLTSEKKKNKLAMG